jgi:septum formation protein
LLVLASASPARKALLEAAGFKPDLILPADIDETPRKDEKPTAYVQRLAEEKALTIQKLHPNAYIIAADTIAVMGARIIGKAADRAEAEKIITRFSGRRHRVLTGLCILSPNGKKSVRLVSSAVKCRMVQAAEIQTYLDSGEWEGKSGCYGLQGRASAFIETINGSYTSIIGLPIAETIAILNGMGFR